jgi:hypothetical protein
MVMCTSSGYALNVGNLPDVLAWELSDDNFGSFDIAG